MPPTTPLVSLPGTVQKAPAGVQGFDVNQPLSAADAQALKNAGYDFCLRYIPRVSVKNCLTNAEALAILNAGIALMPVQHVSPDNWHPSKQLGTDYGNTAANYAKNVVGLPPGMNVWCDLEMIAPHTFAADVIAYCQAWYTAVHAAGYIPGVYVGFHAILNSEQLYNDISFKHYWSAYNNDIPVATRGFQLMQSEVISPTGIEIGPDKTQNDHLGDAVLWLSL